MADAPAAIRVYGATWVPPFAQGLVRDLRVRWALEEAGWPYRVELLDGAARAGEAYRARQPFGQLPAYEEDGLVLFESGAIVWHIAERAPALLPDDAAGRAEALTWLFAALNTVEPPIQQLAGIDLFPGDKALNKARRPEVVKAVRRRLAPVAARLEDREHLVGRFTTADILMATVLRILRHTDLVAEHPSLTAYLERCEARPAFRKAVADQLADYAAHPPG